MSNLRTEQPVFETDRITDGFDIFFWVFNDASSFVATHCILPSRLCIL